jgi:hypothetical protein
MTNPRNIPLKVKLVPVIGFVLISVGIVSYFITDKMIKYNVQKVFITLLMVPISHSGSTRITDIVLVLLAFD